MIRYCPNCRKDIDFTIKSMKDLDSLICPDCGSKVDKDSRSPEYMEVSRASDQTESAIGNTIGCFARLNYLFYVAVSIFSIVAYNFHWDKVLYISTGILLLSFLIMRILGFYTFPTGIIFLPLGAAAGYFILKSIRGACLGIAIVFIIRHLFRALFWNLIMKLTRWV